MALFLHGVTFPLYLSHIREACQILAIDSYRYSDSGRDAAKGVGNSQGKADVARNIPSSPNLTKVAEFEGINSQFSILCFFPSIYLLGVPSGGSLTRRAKIREDLLSPDPLDSQAALGVIDSDPIPNLALELRMRKIPRAACVFVTLACARAQ